MKNGFKRSASFKLALVMTGITTSSTLLAQGASEAEMEEIIVTGSQVALPEAYAGGQMARGGRAGMLGNLDMMESPFASSNFTEDLIRQQQAVSVADVMQNDPVVRVAKGFGNFQELYMIRGFPVYSDDMTYNGVYGVLPRQFVAAEIAERVEVFRGASAFLNGAAPGGSSLGGSVNLVPKRASDIDLNRVTVGLESGGQRQLAGDVSRRFGTADATGVRGNIVSRDGETSVDDQERELTAMSLGLDHQGERLRLSADMGYQDHRIDQPRPSATPSGDIPDAPSAETNFGQPWTFTDEEQFFGAVRGEYDINQDLRAWAALGARQGEEVNRLANPTVSAEGSTSAYRFDNVREDDILSGEVGLRAELDYRGVSHAVTVTASSYAMESRNAYAFSSFSGFAGDLYDPFAVDAPDADFFVGGSMEAPYITEKVDNESVAVADMMSFLNDQVLLTVGARWQNIATTSFDYNSGTELSRYDESRVTPVLGIVYKPSETVSLYANYIEGLLPGEIAPATSGGSPVLNAGEVFDPYQSEQLEIGVKGDFGSIGGAISLYQTSRPSSYVENNIFGTHGEQENRGLEISAFGEITPDVRIIAGFTRLEAEQTQTMNGQFDGNTAVGSPENQSNINVEWDTPVSGLTVEGRIVNTGSQYADPGNIIKLESWQRYDLGLRYARRFNDKPVTLRARLRNATDENQWVSVGGFPGSNYLVLGEPRTLVMSASVDF